MRVLSIALAGCALMVGAAEGQAPAFKIGYVNSAVILEQAPGYKEASDQFAAYMRSTEQEIEQMGRALEELMRSFERQRITLSPQATTQRENEINTRRQEYQTRVGQAEEQAGQRQSDLLKPVMDRINAVIEQVRVDGTYSLIFDVVAGSIVTADKSLDLTEEVIRRLKAQAPPGTR
jgi:outer membrane protein